LSSPLCLFTWRRLAE